MANPVHHPDMELVAGDSWAIVCNLLDTSGAPLDLTAADVMQCPNSPLSSKVTDLIATGMVSDTSNTRLICLERIVEAL